MNLPSSQAEARLREDVKATKTIAITIAAYFFCFIPTTVFTAVVDKEDDDDDWLSFTAFTFTAFTGFLLLLSRAR